MRGTHMQPAKDKGLAYYSKNNQNIIAAQMCSGGFWCAMRLLTLLEKKQNNPSVHFRHGQTTLPHTYLR